MARILVDNHAQLNTLKRVWFLSMHNHKKYFRSFCALNSLDTVPYHGRQEITQLLQELSAISRLGVKRFPKLKPVCLLQFGCNRSPQVAFGVQV